MPGRVISAVLLLVVGCAGVGQSPEWQPQPLPPPWTETAGPRPMAERIWPLSPQPGPPQGAGNRLTRAAERGTSIGSLDVERLAARQAGPDGLADHRAAGLPTPWWPYTVGLLLGLGIGVAGWLWAQRRSSPQ